MALRLFPSPTQLENGETDHAGALQRTTVLHGASAGIRSGRGRTAAAATQCKTWRLLPQASSAHAWQLKNSRPKRQGNQSQPHETPEAKQTNKEKGPKIHYGRVSRRNEYNLNLLHEETYRTRNRTIPKGKGKIIPQKTQPQVEDKIKWRRPDSSLTSDFDMLATTSKQGLV